jgi:hypothetical protein
MSARQLPLILLGLMARLLGAQGITTAAMEGAVEADDGSPIRGAIVRVTNDLNGRRWEISTRSGGRFFFEDLSVGGPYRVEVRALGFSPEVRTGLTLSLGERVRVQFALKPVPITLEEVTVTANIDPVLNSGRVGPAQIVSRLRIVDLPNHGRDFLSLTTMSPQIVISPSSGSAPTGGVTIAGQNRLLNSLQVDGGTNGDLYTGGFPGRESLPRPISLEAIEEIQILAAPFDVRYGGFSGGLINAVTRSGGNAVHGSMFVFFQTATLTGSGVSGKLEDFETWQYGGSVGGPIVRDRAHYFLSLDLQRRTVPDPGPLLTASSAVDPNRPTYADAVRFQDILSDSFDLEPGTLGPVTGRQPAADVFGKIGLEIGPNNHLDIAHHYTHGERESYQGRRAQLYTLSSTGQTNPSTANASSIIWTSMIGGRWSSELVVSNLHLNDQCRPLSEYPAIVVQTTPGGQLWAGSHASCPSRSVVQSVREITGNLTSGIGTHTVTLGMHGESLHFRDALLGGGRGNWTFPSLDDFAVGRASRYGRTLPGSAPIGAVDFGAGEIGVYVQDRWTPTRRLAVTLGLRLDRHFLPDPVATDTSLKNALDIDTGQLPGGRAILSPRLGFNYDISGEGRGYVRGGVGLFAGGVPYIWLANAYRDNGTRELFLTCAGARVPAFDPVNQPATCTSGPGPQRRISFFDPGLKFPQTVKFTFGVDHRLAGEIIGTADVLYTRSLHQLYVSDANLVGPQGAAAGEGNRTLYGTISALGTATATRRTPAFGQVIRISNKSADHTLSLSGQLRKQFGEILETSALYSFTRARDQMSLVNFVARQNLEHTPLDGTLENRALRASYFEVPHRVQLVATARLQHGVRLSLLYAGASGTPYTYVSAGDLNADGMPTSQFAPEIVYVPLDSADIALVDPAEWQQLNKVIEGERCLRNQRGRILKRNSCRNPWFGTLNARASKAFPTVGGQSIELTGDMYNLLNLMNRGWGLFRVTAPTPAWPLLQLSRYDTNAQRGVYNLTLPILRDVRDLEGRWSRWLAELSLRYVF